MNALSCLRLGLLACVACGGEPAPVPAVARSSAAPIPDSGAVQEDRSATGSTSAADGGPPATTGPFELTFKSLALPGATAPASIDYVAFEPAHARVWVPVGGAGSVDVYDTASGTFTSVGGFKTAEHELKGQKRTTGPSAVAVGDGIAYVGNRAISEVCAVDTGTLKIGTCSKLQSSTDGVAYVASAKEVWVTTPRDRSIAVLDASRPGALKVKVTVKLDGKPEGYATDPSRGLFFTNLEDKNQTVVIDVPTHVPKATWSLDCGADGPRGIAADGGRGFVFVACTDHLVVLDGTHGGAKLAEVDTGPGVDNIDWLQSKRLLFAAAGKAAKVTVARIDDKGQPTVVATGATTAGARNGVADSIGNLYVPDPVNARLLVFERAAAP